MYNIWILPVMQSNFTILHIQKNNLGPQVLNDEPKSFHWRGWGCLGGKCHQEFSNRANGSGSRSICMSVCVCMVQVDLAKYCEFGLIRVKGKMYNCTKCTIIVCLESSSSVIWPFLILHSCHPCQTTPNIDSFFHFWKSPDTSLAIWCKVHYNFIKYWNRIVKINWRKAQVSEVGILDAID
jgi:hypothetical protein